MINFGGIGDEIFFLPSIISLKQEYKDAHITLALESRSKSIKDLTDVIDDLIFVDIKTKNKYVELLKLIFKARLGIYDIVISSGSNKMISILLFLTGIKRRIGYNTGSLSKKLLTDVVILDKQKYACDMYHELVSPITQIKTDLPIFNIAKENIIHNSVLIHPGVSKISIQKGIIKTITPNIWADVINKLLDKGKLVILAGGPDDEECINKIRQNVNTSSHNFVDYYGKTKNIRDLAILIGKAEKFICSDSAPLHIAVGMKTKVYPIFGPTNSETLTPKSDLVVPIELRDCCNLKPCLWEKRQTTCEELSCLQINADDIVEIIERY